MVKLELSEYHYFDDILIDLKLTPDDVEIPIPKYFVNENFRALRDREHFLEHILSSLKADEEKSEEVQMTLDQAIRLIQRHERARQGRIRAKFMREIRQQEEVEKSKGEDRKTYTQEEAAIIFQKIWRGFCCRKKVHAMRNEELVWLGMVPSNLHHIAQKSSITKLADRVDAVRRVTQNIYEQEYQQALVKVKEKIRDTEGPDMRETMRDQMRQWFIECRDATGRFPDYPEEGEGGSAAIFKEKTPEELERELKEKEEASQKGKGKDKGKAKKPSPKKDDKQKKKKKGEDEQEGFKMSPSAFLGDLHEGCHNYQ
uniref:Uncharacterized protein n=1 Tax=Trichobilharzia regenti TaxID=157069 RepID=A0AA85KA81_TRIRE